MSKRVTIDQLGELLEQDQRDGLGKQLQQLLTRGTPDLLDHLWCAVGRPLQLAKTKERYRQRFPQRPEWETRTHRHHTLLLPVEPKASIVDLAKGFHIQFQGTNDTFEPVDAAGELPEWKEPHWMWCQAGPWFFNWEPRKVRSEGCASKEYPCSVLEGLHIWGLTGLYPFMTDCPRSVRREGRHCYGYVGLWDNGPELFWGQDGNVNPQYGAGSRGE